MFAADSFLTVSHSIRLERGPTDPTAIGTQSDTTLSLSNSNIITGTSLNCTPRKSNLPLPRGSGAAAATNSKIEQRSLALLGEKFSGPSTILTGRSEEDGETTGSVKSSESEEGGEENIAPGQVKPSRVPKRNRRDNMELKLSEEEARMKGAPQGPVYQVDVLETHQFQASEDPDEELQNVLNACTSGDWAEEYSAIDSLRRLAIFHAPVLQRRGVLAKALPFIREGILNLRSSMNRNALMALKEFLTLLGSESLEANSQYLSGVVDAAVCRCAGDKKFIAAAASDALSAGAGARDAAPLLLRLLLRCVNDKSGEVAAKATIYVDACLATLLSDIGNTAAISDGQQQIVNSSVVPPNVDLPSLIRAMNKSLAGKHAEGRAAARGALGRIQSAVGPDMFISVVRSTLPGADAGTVIKAIESKVDGNSRRTGAMSVRGNAVPSARGTSKGSTSVGRSTLKDRVMAQRRKHERDENGSERGGASTSPGGSNISTSTSSIAGDQELANLNADVCAFAISSTGGHVGVMHVRGSACLPPAPSSSSSTHSISVSSGSDAGAAAPLCPPTNTGTAHGTHDTL